MTTNTLPQISSLWDRQDPAGSQARFVNQLPGAESSGNMAYFVELLTQLARAQSLQRNFEAAHASLDRAKRILDAEDPHALRRSMILYLLERGRAYVSSGYEDRAEDYFLEAYEMGLGSAEEALAIDAAHMLGIMTEGTESMDWFCKALKQAEIGLDGLARRWQAPLLELIARSFEQSADLESARQMHERARQCRIEQWQTVPALPEDAVGRLPACPECLTDGSLLVCAG
jgi:tetratricopeptide (TPR) repeat protein